MQTMYVVNQGLDKLGQKFYYCHMKGFPYIPVEGSIGSYQKARAVCRLMNYERG